MTKRKLEGRAAIITGATSGIGEATAMMMIQEGAKVTIAGRDKATGDKAAAKLRAAGGDVLFVPTDASKKADIERLFASHMEKFGRIDVLFNNAGYEGPGTLMVDTTEEEFDLVMDTNLKGVFRTCKLAAPIMMKQKSGSIINTTSASAREGCVWPHLSAYVASKGAITAFTRAMAFELSPHGIRVNTLNPGTVDTATFRKYAEKRPDSEAYIKQAAEMQLVKRIGAPEELARAAMFLATDDGSFVTGIDFLVDGGFVLGAGRC